MQALPKPTRATSPYLNRPRRSRHQAAQDALERAIKQLRAQVIWRANRTTGDVK